MNVEKFKSLLNCLNRAHYILSHIKEDITFDENPKQYDSFSNLQDMINEVVQELFKHASIYKIELCKDETSILME